MKHLLTVLLAAFIVISGCAQEKKKNEPVTRIVTVPALAKDAVAAVGGEPAWEKTEVILGECTAKFYKPDGTFYLTRQRHAVYPWSDSVRVYASEPQGTFVWQLSGSEFVVLHGFPEDAAHLPITVCDKSIARAIWNIMAAPASIATQTDANTAVIGKAASIEGIWHYPLKLAGGQCWYQNRDSDIFDIYTVDPPTAIMARGYDYRKIEKTGVFVPGKVELFTIDPAASEPRRIIEFNYHTLESVAF
jgi:hypothetical protein